MICLLTITYGGLLFPVGMCRNHAWSLYNSIHEHQKDPLESKNLKYSTSQILFAPYDFNSLFSLLSFHFYHNCGSHEGRDDTFIKNIYIFILNKIWGGYLAKLPREAKGVAETTSVDLGS
jgi:hypothetical protein